MAFACRLADIADQRSMARFSPSGVPAWSKDDGSPVTRADAEIEQELRRQVERFRPGDGFVGEEVGASDGESGRRWIVDGISGTLFYVAGEPTWGTLIALHEPSGVSVGMVTSPALGRRWWAERGHGAYTGSILDGELADVRRIAVSESRDPSPGRTAVLPYAADLNGPQAELLALLGGGLPSNKPWCHQLQVAEGLLDLAVWFTGGPWDLAALSLIVEEAGGHFFDLSGGRSIDRESGVFSNHAMHDQLLAGIALHRFGERGTQHDP